jgi:hypothetical protein
MCFSVVSHSYWKVLYSISCDLDLAKLWNTTAYNNMTHIVNIDARPTAPLDTSAIVLNFTNAYGHQYKLAQVQDEAAVWRYSYAFRLFTNATLSPSARAEIHTALLATWKEMIPGNSRIDGCMHILQLLVHNV